MHLTMMTACVLTLTTISAFVHVPLFLSLIVDMTGLQVASAAGLSGAAATQDNAASFGSRSVAGVEPNPNISRHNEAHLAQFLLTNYNPAARPVRNISSTTVLQISFYIVQILKLSEKDQIMTATVWLNLDWSDEYLIWDNEQWGIEKIRLPAELIWNPDLTLYNNAQESDPIMTNMKASYAVIRYDGKVELWPRPLILQSNCPIDVLYFPFDIQDCFLRFSSWAYNSQQVKLVSTAGIHLSSYIPSTEWELIHAQTEIEYNPFEEGGGYSFVKFQLKIQRKALYYIVNLIMPCIMLSLVMLFGQYLPCNSGDAKVQLGTALFTSMCVFLLLVGTMMPPSDVQPLLGVYYGVTLMLITLSTGINVFVLNIVDRDTPVPRWVRIVFLHYIANYVAPSLRQPYPGYKTPSFKNKANSNCKSKHNSQSQQASAMTISENDNWAHVGVNLVNEYQNNVQFSSRLASHTSTYHVTTGTSCFPKTPDSPIREITELRLDENGKQLVQVRKYLEWIRIHVETLLNEMNEKNEASKLQSDWQDVAVIIDRSLMIIFTVIVLSATLYIYNQYPASLIRPVNNPAQPGIVIQNN